MKRVLIAVIIILTFGYFTSCSDETTQPTTQQIAGKQEQLKNTVEFEPGYVPGRDSIPQNVTIASGMWKGKQVQYAKGHIVVALSEGVNPKDISLVMDKFNLTFLKRFDILKAALLKVSSDSNALEMIQKLQNLKLFRYVEPNLICHTTSTFPNDPGLINYHWQWNLHNTGYYSGAIEDADIDAPEGWDIETGDHVKVAILDSGMPMNSTGSFTHPDLNDGLKFWRGVDFCSTDNDNIIRDLNGHGTHVLGIAGAETNNGIGIAGVNWGCRLYIYQVFDQNGLGTFSGIHDAIISAVNIGVDIINMSGGGDYSSYVEDAVQYANNNGVLQVYSAGNEGSDGVVYPAKFVTSYPTVMSIAATDWADNRAYYSSYDPGYIHISVAAPGGNGSIGSPGGVYSTMPNYHVTLNDYPHYPVARNYGRLSGTSMAAPHVSGLAALVMTKHPTYSAIQVKDLIQSTAENVNGGSNPDRYIGYGRINMYNALSQ